RRATRSWRGRWPRWPRRASGGEQSWRILSWARTAEPLVYCARGGQDRGPPMAHRFSGKVVVITGASSGIGAVAARKFAGEGATVALLARSAGALEKVAADIRGSGGAARAFPVDVSDPGACAEVLRKVEDVCGGIDVLVNNAGRNRRGPVETMDPGELS